MHWPWYATNKNRDHSFAFAQNATKWLVLETNADYLITIYLKMYFHLFQLIATSLLLLER